MKIKKYLLRGIKLTLILILGGLIMLIPQLFVMLNIFISPGIGFVLWIISLLVGLTVNGWLFTKYKNFIYK